MSRPRRTSNKAKVLALSSGKAIASVSNIAVFALLSRIFVDKADYATFRQTLLAYMIAAPLLTLGMNQAIFYFLPGEKDRIRGRFIDTIIVMLVTSGLFSISLVLGLNELLAKQFSNPEIAKMLLLMIPFVFAYSLIQVFEPVLTVRDKIFELSIYNVLTRILIAAGSVVPVLIWLTPGSAIIGRTIAGVVACLWGLYLVFRVLPRDSFVPDLGSIREMTIFSLPLGFASAIGALNIQLDKFVVSSYCDPEQFAVFANGAIEIPLIGILTGSIIVVLLVDMRTAVTEGRFDDAVAMFRQTASQTSYVLFPVAIFLFIFADSFMVCLFSLEYVESSLPFRVYLLLIPIRTVVFGALMLALGMNTQILYRGLIGLICNYGLSVMLVRWMGPIGAAVSTVVLVLFWSVPFNLLTLGHRLNVSWRGLLPWKHFGKVSLELTWFTVFFVSFAIATQNLSHILRFISAAAIASLWMAFWWNGKVYDAGKLSKRLGRLAGSP